MLINDRFDIWEIDPTGVKPAVVVTDSVGRRNSITFRIVNLGDEENPALVVEAVVVVAAVEEELLLNQ